MTALLLSSRSLLNSVITISKAIFSKQVAVLSSLEELRSIPHSLCMMYKKAGVNSFLPWYLSRIVHSFAIASRNAHEESVSTLLRRPLEAFQLDLNSPGDAIEAFHHL